MRTLLILMSLLSLSGCMSNSVKVTPAPVSNQADSATNTQVDAQKNDEDITDAVSNQRLQLYPLVSDSNKVLIKDKLTTQYLTWQGVPYRLGGLSKKGIDCSGFVYLTFLEQFEIKLPRSTSTQIKVGKKIARDQLQVGDLIFFNTKRNQKHVGIYFGESNFIHASTRGGVIISSLLNSYWSSAYWFASRL